MAKAPINTGAAMDMVSENFGLTEDDLGMNPSEDAFEQESDITEDDLLPEPQGDDQADIDQLGDRGGVTHTQPQDRRQQQQPQQRQQPDNQQQQQPLPLHSRAEVRPDAKGNLVNAQGQVVATAGREARYYQDAFRARQGEASIRAQHADVSNRLTRAIEIGTTLVDQVEEFKRKDKEIADMGITPEERMQAFTFITQAKANPVQAIKGILTMAASRGIDLSQLGIAGGAIDTQSLLSVIRNELKTVTNPIVDANRRQQQQEQQRQQETQEQQRTRDYASNFFRDNPQAQQFLPVFEKLYAVPEFANMPLAEAWLRIQLNLRDKQQSQQRTTPNTQQSRRMPNARPGFVPNAVENGQTDHTGLAPVSDSYESIVRQAMALAS